MGKLGGFLKIERHGVPHRDPLERVHDYREFQLQRPVDELREQGARCMDCGVPFCHNGCPLGNLIPDWNDLVYRDRYSTAWMGWRSAFYVPGVLAVLCAIYLVARLRDTPQSVGLPPIEEYRNEYPEHGARDREAELGTRELVVTYILRNRYLWLFAAANFFVYLARYSMLDWGPTYLKEVKHASLEQGGFSTAIYELGGMFSTVLMGWLSDKAGGRRGMVSVLCMVPVFLAFGGILYAPPGMLWLDLTLFGIIGFFIYPPVMLLPVMGLDFTSKKAVGTAAGFIGLFGYLGRTVQGKGIGTLAERYGWDAAFYGILASTLLGILLLSWTWNLKPRAAGTRPLDVAGVAAPKGGAA